MDSEKTIPFDALVSDASVREAFKVRQLESIADSLSKLLYIFENSCHHGWLNVNTKPWDQ